jgi:hypothetical protein
MLPKTMFDNIFLRDFAEWMLDMIPTAMLDMIPTAGFF